MTEKRGLQLDRVVLLGRTFEEYCRFFLLEPEKLAGKRVLDIAGGVSSFCAEANARGIRVTSVDPIYELGLEEIRSRANPDLDLVCRSVHGLPTYKWDYYRNPDRLRELRERSSRIFLEDYARHRGERYIAGALPELPFRDGEFDLALVSYFLFVYEERLNYEFHRDSLLAIMRLTRGELRVYPTVTFEGVPSAHLARLRSDPALAPFHWEEVKTDFEFLVNSNCFLRVTRKMEDVSRSRGEGNAGCKRSN